MAPGGTQSGVLQQLGVSYFQIIDYSSKEYIATLVGSTHDLQAYRSAQTKLGSSLHVGNDSMGLHHHLVWVLISSGLILLKPRMFSDGEIAFFWQAERRSRWSVARILFILVSPSIC